jgi:hypothetical protein
MKMVWFAGAFGAALLLSAATVAVNAMGGGSCHLPKTCAVDLDSLCAGVPVGDGRLPACLKARMANLSAPCSAKLSREVYVASACDADSKRFCSNAISGGDRIASCIRTHLGEVSNSCKGVYRCASEHLSVASRENAAMYPPAAPAQARAAGNRACEERAPPGGPWYASRSPPPPSTRSPRPSLLGSAATRQSLRTFPN